MKKFEELHVLRKAVLFLFGNYNPNFFSLLSKLNIVESY